jgi:NNP family nitrate/nitrite transporter-like MFS transporter
MVWVMLGPLGVQIASDLEFDNAQKGLMVAVPVLAGAGFRVVLGVVVDHLKPRRAGLIAQAIVLAGIFTIWLIGIDSFAGVLLAGVILGVAGASFAVALPLASRWYPPEHQGTALGIAGAGNSGTVLAALFAPGLAAAFGWINVFGLALIPLGAALRSTSSTPRTVPPRHRPRVGWSISPSCASATPGGSCSSTPSPSAVSSVSPLRSRSTSTSITV